jgi:hypothetical protein
MPTQSDLMSIFVNIGANIPIFIMLVQGCASLTGLFLVGTGLIDLMLVSNPGSEKHFAGGRSASTSGAITKLLVGALFTSFGTLELVGVLSRTITGDYVNSRALSYTSSGGSLQDQAQLATMGLLALMQAVGTCAIFRGLLALNDRGNGQNNTSLGKVFVWLIGGVLAWNFQWTSDLINNTIGFNVISLFTPWS